MLQKIKESLRIKHNALDNDLSDLVGACKRDLRRVGVVQVSEDDFLILQAAKLYTKWQLNFEGDSDRYRMAYESLRDSLSLCGDYNV